MAAFPELDWRRFDLWSILAAHGVVVVDPAHHESCRAWLRRNGYGTSTINFRQGIGPAVLALGELFGWEQQFGHALRAESRNLDALRDGFYFDLQPGQGHALELLSAEVAHAEDPRWFQGLLSITHQHSLEQLATGARFFAVLVLDRDSPLVGVPYETLSVPCPYWRAPGRDPFDSPPGSGDATRLGQ